MLKKITSFIVFTLILLSLFGCNSVESNENYYSLELINFSDYLVEPLESKYKVGVTVEVITTIIYDADLELYLNNEKISQTWSDVPFWKYEFIMPAMDSFLEFKVITKQQIETDIHDYVEIQNASIPSEYFDCELIEVSLEDFYDFSSISSMIGDNNSHNFEYGNLMNADLVSKSIYQSFLIFNKMENDSLYQTESYLYVEKINEVVALETYQYQQQENLEVYLFNQTDGDFCFSKFTMEHLYNNSFYYDIHPSRLNLLNYELDSVTYKMGSNNDNTYVSISGTFNDYPNRLEYYNVFCEIVYIINNNEIVAWLYTETVTGPNVEGYWETIQYCIPYEGEISLIDDQVLNNIN